MKRNRGIIATDGADIPFTVTYSPRRTVQIAVAADGSVSIRAPSGASFADVEAIVLRRTEWIARKVAAFRERALAHPAPVYCDGERHLFLGQAYPLRFEAAKRGGVLLRDGTFVVMGGGLSPDDVRTLLRRWYAAQAPWVFRESFDRCWPSFVPFGRSEPALRHRFMTSRWGSWSARGAITMNTHLVQVAPALIDSVMAHELCHMIHPNHGRAFYDVLGAVLPDWREHRRRLNGLPVIR